MRPRQKRQSDFSQLQKLWYAILRRDGFEDCETLINDQMYLKRFHSRIFNEVEPDRFAAKQLYFQLAGQFLHSHDFRSDNERLVWSLHCEGFSVARIRKLVRMPVVTIRAWIAKLKRQMLWECSHGF
jgi:hypothetical protein